MRKGQKEDVIAWQKRSATLYVMARNAMEHNYLLHASHYQEKAAMVSRWAREAMGIEPRTWLD